MTNVINLNAIENYLEKLKANGGMWEIGKGKYAIKHLELEKLATLYNVETNIDLIHCNLEKNCAVVKAIANYNAKSYFSFGEVSPDNNDFPYPVAVAEKRAVDRVILKALGIHGTVYSDQELSTKKTTVNENEGISLEHGDIILQKIKVCSHQANLDELKSKNKNYLIQLQKKNLKRFEQIKKAFLDRNQQFIGG